jgi:hypothetical protein
MRLLNIAKNTKRAVAAEELTYGVFAFINSDGHFEHPKGASDAAKAVYLIVRPAEMSRTFTGYDNKVAKDELCQGVNGCEVELYTEALDISTDITGVAKGAKMGITNSGKATPTGSAAANTTGFLVKDSFTGNTTSGILRAHVDFMI